MITDRVWGEMYHVKGYILQIELYTDNRRKRNRYGTYITIFCAIASAITSFFPDCKWGTIAASIIVAACTILKEWVPNIFQPEDELKELDRIHDFYKDYFQKLENLFMERHDSNSIVNDSVMRQQFNEIKNTEKDNETELNRLCRSLTKKEINTIKEQVNGYFNRTYQGIYNEE